MPGLPYSFSLLFWWSSCFPGIHQYHHRSCLWRRASYLKKTLPRSTGTGKELAGAAGGSGSLSLSCLKKLPSPPCPKPSNMIDILYLRSVITHRTVAALKGNAGCFFSFGDGVSLCAPGWSAMAQSWLTATLIS